MQLDLVVDHHLCAEGLRHFVADQARHDIVTGLPNRLSFDAHLAGLITARETAEPFSVTVDLSAAAAGTTVMLLVRGSTGLETDPGDFAAIPVTISG